MCVYEGRIRHKAPKEGWLHRTLYKKKEELEIFFTKRRSIDRKNCKKTRKKKQEIFIRRDRRAFD